MKELTGIISEATAAIEQGYFRVEIDGGMPVYRERVYCYELYHQMRSRWPAGYCLNGELDKIAHPILKKLHADKRKPDFLVHKPGDMSWNHAIIEVKTAGAARCDIHKDISTLDLFVRKVGYQRAIYLFFGHAADDGLIDRIQSAADEFDELVPIEIWFHSKVGESATHNTTLQRNANGVLFLCPHLITHYERPFHLPVFRCHWMAGVAGDYREAYAFHAGQ